MDYKKLCDILCLAACMTETDAKEEEKKAKNKKSEKPDKTSPNSDKKKK